MSCLLLNDTATTHIYTLSLHDALPIYELDAPQERLVLLGVVASFRDQAADALVTLVDRKSTRLNSSHRCISYAVFCLKNKKITSTHQNSSASRRHKLPHNLQQTRATPQ